MKRALFVAVFVVGLGVVVGVLTTGAGGSSREDRFSLAEAREFDGWPLYDAGESVAGIPRGEILRDPGTVTFIYGDCEPPVGDGGCSPPAQIQISPACIRHIALYGSGPGNVVPEKTTVRGVPAAWFEGRARLEIYTGISTVVIFGHSRKMNLRIAHKLKSVNVEQAAGDRLPSPAAGALTGDLEC